MQGVDNNSMETRFISYRVQHVIIVPMHPSNTAYWFFLSCALNVFETSDLTGFCTLASAVKPKKSTGTRMKKDTSRVLIRAGVSSWYLFRMPPSGRVVLS